MKKWYTNGAITKKLDLDAGDVLPEGFYPGRTCTYKPWNKGLTAKTDSRVKANTDSCHETRRKRNNYKSWNEGLTKETNESLLQVSQKVQKYRTGKPAWNKGIPASETQKQRQSASMKGKPAWNKGLTKDTNESIAASATKLLGHECFVTDWKVAKQKEHDTKKVNGTFCTSQPEEDYYKLLVENFGKEEVIRQYRDERYPFNCDFYIKSIDLFIELNFSWTHGQKQFEDSEEDRQLLERWKTKALTSKYYAQAIHVWTESDVIKLCTFRQNHLNFIIIYPNNYIITE